MDVQSKSVDSQQRKKHKRRRSQSNSSPITPDPKKANKELQIFTPSKSENLNVSSVSTGSKKLKTKKKTQQSTEDLTEAVTPSAAKRPKLHLVEKQLDANEDDCKSEKNGEEVTDELKTTTLESIPPSNNYILVGNIPNVTNENKLRDYLQENNMEVDELHWVAHNPMAIVKINSDAKLHEVEAKLQHQSLGWAKLHGNVEPLLSRRKPQKIETSIFVVHLAPNSAKSDFEKHLPSSITPGTWSIAFLNTNPHSTSPTSAKITFASLDDAKAAIQALNKVKVNGSKVKASMFVDRANRDAKNSPAKPANSSATTDKSDAVKSTLHVRNLPITTDFRRMKELFPTAVDYDLKRRGATNTCFVTFGDADACRDAHDSIKGLVLDDLEVSANIVTTKKKKNPTQKADAEEVELGTVLKVSNLPFSYNESQIASEFPTAAQVYLKKHGANKSAGIAFLNFNSAEDCRAVFEACKQKTIEKRSVRCFPSAEFPKDRDEEKKRKPVKESKTTELHTLRVSNAPYSLSEKELKKYFPQATQIQVVKGDNGLSKGIFLVSFSDLSQCQAAQKSIVGVKVEGRALRSEIQKPDTKEANPDRTQEEPQEKKTTVKDSVTPQNTKTTPKKTKANKNSALAEDSDSDDSSD